jgi:hypothetical protein
MSHLTGSFSSPNAGKLLCTFRGTFYTNAAPRDAGFPAPPGSGGIYEADILVRAFVGPTAGGVRRYTEPIDRYAPVAYLVMDYPGGGASWPIGSEEVSHQSPSSGFWSYGLSALLLEIKLVKV